MKPDTVYLKALEFSLCLNCLKLGHWASACPHPGCAKDNCNARHHPLMHGHSTNPLKPLKHSKFRVPIGHTGGGRGTL